MIVEDVKSDKSAMKLVHKFIQLSLLITSSCFSSIGTFQAIFNVNLISDLQLLENLCRYVGDDYG